MIPHLLSIAGSDPSGGAGIQADLKTFSALGCYGMAALTALTAQNTRGVTSVHVPPPEFLAAQLDAIFADIRVDAVKIGMLATGDMVRTVARCLAAHPGIPVVLDPVLVATSGDSLGSPDVVDAIVSHLLPLATVVTPNLPEAARLSGLDAIARRGRHAGGRSADPGSRRPGRAGEGRPSRRRRGRGPALRRRRDPLLPCPPDRHAPTLMAPAARCRRRSPAIWRKALPSPMRSTPPSPI